jgi:hypothetical protein
MLTTVGVGCAVAAAQLVQGPLVLGLVLATSIVWLLSPLCVVALLARHLRRRSTPGALAPVGVFAALVGAANLTLLGLIRVVRHRPALVWNIDARNHLNHAQTIARHADLSTALDYLGTDVRYHVGPAWIAGAFQYFTGWGLTDLSFLALPFMTAVVTLAAGAYLCRRLGAGRGASVFAAGVLLVVPALTFDWVQIIRSPMNLRGPSAYTFSASFIPNGQLAWAVGVASLALVATARTRLMAVGSVGLATLAALKPQYFAGFMIAAAATSVVQISAANSQSSHLTRRFASSLFVGGAAGLLILTLGGGDGELGSPVFRPFATGVDWTRFRGSALAVLVLCIVAVSVWKRARRLALLRAAVVLGLCGIAMAAVLSVVQVPVKPGTIAHARAVGLLIGAASRQGDFATSIDIVLLVGTLFALAGFAVLLPRVHAHGSWAVAGIGLLAALALVPVLIAGARHPLGPSAHEPVDERGLYEVLTSVPVGGSIIVASDLADPADNHLRSLRSPLLTGYAGNQFVIANLAYLNYDEPDAAERLASLQRFFGSDSWSSWHSQFVEKFGVTHVLINDRCPPNWTSWPERLSVVSSSGGWSIAEVKTPSRGELDPVDTGSWTSLTARFGTAPCLNGA